MTVTNDDKVPNLAKILRQLEYYFGDSNLPSDKFLKAKMKENEEGYVDISVLLTFNRLKDLGATTEAIVSSLKSSSLLAANEAGTRLRRVKPLPDKPEFDSRSVVVSGWPVNGAEPTIDEVIGLFAPCGKVLRIVLRRKYTTPGGHRDYQQHDAKGKGTGTKEEGRDKQRKFIGSVFVEMESAEAAERVVAEEFEITVKNEETGVESKRKLHSELFVDYDKKRKSKPRKDRRSGDKNGDKQQGTKRKREDENGDDANNNNNNNEKKDSDNNKPTTENGSAENGVAGSKQDQENGMQASTDPTTTDVAATNGDGDVKHEDKKLKTDDDTTTNGDGTPAKEDKENDSGVVDVEYEKGLVIMLAGLAENTTREDVRETMEVYGNVAWIDLSRGDVQGHVRFSEACEAKRAVEEMVRDKATINGEVPELVKLLEDEEEKAYWIKVQLKKNERRNGRDGRRGRGGGRHRGGRRGGRGFGRRGGGRT